MKLMALCGTTIGFLLTAVTSVAQVATSQYDNARTGATLVETKLTPQNVNVNQFGKVGVFQVDGAVYAQPLFIPSMEIPGKGKHNVLFIATEHDSVYAFDADHPNAPPLWQVSLLSKKQGTTPVSDRAAQCPFIRPEIGITSTPVIDLRTGTLYVLARTMIEHWIGDTEYFQHLHALAITTGQEKFGGPRLITASVPGRGEGGTNGQVRFDPLRENPRASLLLANNALYLSWASSCDVPTYHGWFMAYDSATLEQRAVLNITPDGSEGGIWESDTGPAADASGNVYVPTANGTFDAASGGRDYGDSVLKLARVGSSLQVRDYFTPYNQSQLSDSDADLGSSGPLLLPDQTGSHPHLLVQPTKAGMIYLIDRDQMGKFNPDGDAIVGRIEISGGGYGAMAYWNGHVYFAGSNDYLRDYTVANGRLSPYKASNFRFENPGATPTISANENKGAILWAVATRTWSGEDRPAIIYAFDAMNVGQPTYTSEQNSKRDRAGLATRFVIPVVADGHLYVAARGEVDVYGLLK
ncbi:MAG: hypothetical protein WA736_11830 [Candidatus Acidiferrum sp.]